MSAPDFEKMAREIETRILDMEISEVFRVRFGIEAVLRSAYEAGARDERERAALAVDALETTVPGGSLLLRTAAAKIRARGGGNG